MGRLGEMVQRRVRVMVDAHATSDDVHARIAEVARANLAELINTRVFSPVYTRYVDGVEGAPEENVKLPGGEIVYLFNQLSEAVAYALTYCKTASPGTGRYSSAWFVVVDGRPWNAPIADIPGDSRIFITNYAPFHRRLEQGWYAAHHTRHREGLFITERARQAVMRRFPSVLAERLFVTIPGPPGGGAIAGWQVPYHRVHPSPKHGEVAGQAITYPALGISERG